MNNKKIWYAYFSSDEYIDSPAFYDSNDFEWGRYVEENFKLINAEVQKIISSGNFTPKNYFVESFNESKEWKTYSFKTWGIEVKKALKETIVIKEMLKKYPRIVSVSINVLGPDSEIIPHHGDSNSFYRCHLGIDIPRGLPVCGFKVNDEVRAWEKGKLLIFCDANKHEAWNKSEEKRVILLFDVIKDEYMSQKFWICINVRAFLVMQLLSERNSKLKNRSKKYHYLLRGIIKLILVMLYPYQKIVGVIKSHN